MLFDYYIYSTRFRCLSTKRLVKVSFKELLFTVLLSELLLFTFTSVKNLLDYSNFY